MMTTMRLMRSMTSTLLHSYTAQATSTLKSGQTKPSPMMTPCKRAGLGRNRTSLLMRLGRNLLKT